MKPNALQFKKNSWYVSENHLVIESKFGEQNREIKTVSLDSKRTDSKSSKLPIFKKNIASKGSFEESLVADLSLELVDDHYPVIVDEVQGSSQLSTLDSNDLVASNGMKFSTQLTSPGSFAISNAASGGSTTLSWLGGLLGTTSVVSTAGGAGVVSNQKESSSSESSNLDIGTNASIKYNIAEVKDSVAPTLGVEDGSLQTDFKAITSFEALNEANNTKNQILATSSKLLDTDTVVLELSEPFVQVEIKNDLNRDGYVNFLESLSREDAKFVTIVVDAKFNSALFKVGDVIQFVEKLSQASQFVTLTQHDIERSIVSVGFPVANLEGTRIRIEAIAETENGIFISNIASSTLDTSNFLSMRNSEVYVKEMGALNITSDLNWDGELDVYEKGDLNAVHVQITLPSDVRVGDTLVVMASDGNEESERVQHIILSDEDVKLGLTTIDVVVPDHGDKLVVSAQISDSANNRSHYMVESLLVNSTPQTEDNEPQEIELLSDVNLSYEGLADALSENLVAVYQDSTLSEINLNGLLEKLVNYSDTDSLIQFTQLFEENQASAELVLNEVFAEFGIPAVNYDVAVAFQSVLDLVAQSTHPIAL